MKNKCIVRTWRLTKYYLYLSHCSARHRFAAVKELLPSFPGYCSKTVVVESVKRSRQLVAITLLKEAIKGQTFNVNEVLKDGETLLSISARTNQKVLVQFLLSLGGWEKDLPISSSIAAGHGDITRLLAGREVLKARDLIVRKLRFYAIIRRKIKGSGGMLGNDVKAAQLVMTSLLTVGGKL